MLIFLLENSTRKQINLFSLACARSCFVVRLCLIEYDVIFFANLSTNSICIVRYAFSVYLQSSMLRITACIAVCIFVKIIRNFLPAALLIFNMRTPTLANKIYVIFFLISV